MPARGWIAGTGLALGAILAGAGLGGHRWATAHVEHYSGGAVLPLGCASCHVDARGGTIRDRILRPVYRTPLDVAACPDGRLLVTAQDAGALLVVDPAAGRVVSEIPAGRRPYAVAPSAGCAKAFVSSHEEDVVTVVDVAAGKPIAALPAGFAPAGVAIDRSGGRLFVANSEGGDVSVVEIASGRETTRLAAGSYPWGAVASPDGSVVLVTNQLARPSRAPDPPVSEVTVVDAVRGRVAARIVLPNAHLLEGAAFVPGTAEALVTLVRPKNLLPALQVERGWMMTNGFAVLDLESGAAVQLPLDDPESFYADPSDVAVTPDARLAFVSHAGVDAVSVVDLEAARRLVRETPPEDRHRLANRLDVGRAYVLRRIPVGAGPRGLALSPDGRTLYVAERLADALGVIDVARMERTGGIDLGGPRHETLVRRGEKVFNSARATLQRQFSCRSCHPDNHMDRLQYDFEPDGLGRNVVDNRTMLGLDGTAPFKWNGKNTSLYMQCGIRFARFLTRSEPFPPQDLNALVAFLRSVPPPRGRHALPGGALTPAQRRGLEIYGRAARRDGSPIPEANRCATCHPAPRYTDSRRSDVGSASQGDGERAFDTPQLNGLAMSAPYLHDGKALTLEEIWTLYSPDDTHGVTSDLGKDGLNDLIEYLRTL